MCVSPLVDLGATEGCSSHGCWRRRRGRAAGSTCGRRNPSVGLQDVLDRGGADVGHGSSQHRGRLGITRSDAWRCLPLLLHHQLMAWPELQITADLSAALSWVLGDAPSTPAPVVVVAACLDLLAKGYGLSESGHI